MEILLIVTVFLSALITFILSALVLIKSNKCFWRSITEQLKRIPIPICIVSSNSNDIIDCNKYFYNFIINEEKINDDNVKNIKLIDIFENFEDYIEIKHLSKDKDNNITNKIVRIITENGIKYAEIKFKYFKIGFRKNIILFFRDITEEIKSFRYLGVFTSLAENTDDGVLISRKNGNGQLPKIIYSNSKLTEITGYEREEILDKPINAIFELNVEEHILNTIKEKVKLMEHSKFKHKYTAKNGKEYWLHTNIIPITNNNIKQALKNVLDSNSNLVNYINKLDDGNVFIVLHQTSLESNGYSSLISEDIPNFKLN